MNDSPEHLEATIVGLQAQRALLKDLLGVERQFRQLAFEAGGCG